MAHRRAAGGIEGLRHSHLERLARISRVSHKSFSWVHRSFQGASQVRGCYPTQPCRGLPNQRQKEIKGKSQKDTAETWSQSRLCSKRPDHERRCWGRSERNGRRTGVWWFVKTKMPNTIKLQRQILTTLISQPGKAGTFQRERSPKGLKVESGQGT